MTAGSGMTEADSGAEQGERNLDWAERRWAVVADPEAAVEDLVRIWDEIVTKAVTPGRLETSETHLAQRALLHPQQTPQSQRQMILDLAAKKAAAVEQGTTFAHYELVRCVAKELLAKTASPELWDIGLEVEDIHDAVAYYTAQNPHLDSATINAYAGHSLLARAGLLRSQNPHVDADVIRRIATRGIDFSIMDRTNTPSDVIEAVWQRVVEEYEQGGEGPILDDTCVKIAHHPNTPPQIRTLAGMGPNWGAVKHYGWDEEEARLAGELHMGGWAASIDELDAVVRKEPE